VPTLLIGSLLMYLVALPLIFLGISSLRPTGMPLESGVTFAHYAEVYGNPGFWRLLRDSAVFAAGSAAVALTLGTLLAWAVERTDMPGSGVVRALVILPMATPPLLLAIGWAMLLSPRAGALNLLLMEWFGLQAAPFNAYSLGGMVFVQGLSLTSTAFLFLSPAFRNMDPSLEEAAMASGAGTVLLFRRVLLPLLAPALLAAGVFLLIVGFVVFEIPGALGLPARIFVLSSQLYFLAADPPGGFPLYGQIAALATAFIALLFLLGLVYRRMTAAASRYRTVTGKGFRPRRMRLGRWRWAALGGVCAYFCLAVVLPVGMLVWTSLMPFQARPSVANLSLITLENHLDFLASPRVFEAVANTALVAVLAATLVAVIATLTAWTTTRLRAPASGLLDTLAFLPIAIPGVMMGVALTYVYLTLDPIIAIYGTVWILVVAYTTEYLSFGNRGGRRDGAAPPGAGGGGAHRRRRNVHGAAANHCAAAVAGDCGDLDLGAGACDARTRHRADAAGARQPGGDDAAVGLLAGRGSHARRRRRRLARAVAAGGAGGVAGAVGEAGACRCLT
jgi:iron(III) transport system permease protein